MKAALNGKTYDPRKARLQNKPTSALIKFAEGLAYCPCCEGVEQCADGCTINEDSQVCADGRDRYENMLAARRALQQDKK